MSLEARVYRPAPPYLSQPPYSPRIPVEEQSGKASLASPKSTSTALVHVPLPNQPHQPRQCWSQAQRRIEIAAKAPPLASWYLLDWTLVIVRRPYTVDQDGSPRLVLLLGRRRLRVKQPSHHCLTMSPFVYLCSCLFLRRWTMAGRYCWQKQPDCLSLGLRPSLAHPSPALPTRTPCKRSYYQAMSVDHQGYLYSPLRWAEGEEGK